MLLENFLSEEDLARVRIVSDIFVYFQKTDMLSASILEHLFCRSILVIGNWLPYEFLCDMGCYIHRIDIDKLPEKLISVINNFSEEKSKTEINEKCVYEYALWEKRISDWVEAYK